MTERTKIAVIYTDGGARPNPGFAGWGMHGYVAEETKPKKGAGCPGYLLTTVGYVEKAKAAHKQEVTPLQYIDGTGPVGTFSSNNAAELVAAIRALTFVIAAGDIKSLLIKPDSEYFRQGLTQWLPGWKAKGWVKSTGEPIKNDVYWKQLDALMSKIKELDIELNVQWIKGHSGHVGNEASDTLATIGVCMAMKNNTEDSITITPTDGYWKADADMSRMISLPRWYFTDFQEPKEDGYSVYYLADHGPEDELIGKAVSDVAYSVVKLREEDPVLDTIRNYHKKCNTDGYNNVVIGRLDHATNSKMYARLKKLKDVTLMTVGDKPDLYDSGKVQLTKVVIPPRLAFRAVDEMGRLHNILNNFKPTNFGNYLVTEITDHIFDVKEGKKEGVKIKPTITSSTRALNLELNYKTDLKKETMNKATVTLTVGLDIAKRNTLAALAPRNPKVYAVTWRESDNSFRYVTIMSVDPIGKTGEGDIGIWASPYSNLRVLS